MWCESIKSSHVAQHQFHPSIHTFCKTFDKGPGRVKFQLAKCALTALNKEEKQEPLRYKCIDGWVPLIMNLLSTLHHVNYTHQFHFNPCIQPCLALYCSGIVPVLICTWVTYQKSKKAQRAKLRY